MADLSQTIELSNRNIEYQKFYSRWKKIRDVLDGEDALKNNDLGLHNVYYEGKRQNYLRPINPSDTSQYNRERNQGYVNGAVFFNGSDRTLQGVIGMVYRKEPEIELPAQLDYLIDNVDGSGIGLAQQSKAVTSDVASVGRDGLLVDMPQFDGEATLADIDGGIRPSIVEYKAESIIDWHERVIDGVRVLDMVLLMECVEEYDYSNPTSIQKDLVKYYKMIFIDDQGAVQVAKWRDDEPSYEVSPMVKGGSGGAFNRIPFVFVGAKNNSPCVDKPPIESIVDVNLGHYQESANLASSSFQLSAAQPWIADDNYQREIRNKKDKGGESEDARMGEGSAFVLGTGGQFNITAPPENSLASGLRDDYKEQMISLGAQLITNGGQAETAEAARIKHASDSSVIDNVANNVSMAYETCIRWAGEFLGVDASDALFQLNREFYDNDLTSEQVRDMVSSWQSGAISKNVLDIKLQRGGVIPSDIDLESMNAEIDTETPILDE